MKNRYPFQAVSLAAFIFALSFRPGLATEAAVERVILNEGFETGKLTGDWVLYHEFGDSVSSGFESRPEFVHSGKNSLRLTAVECQGAESGSNAMYFFPPGVDRCFFRWYAMFARDFDQGDLMHWVIMAGGRVDDKWSAYNKAGIRPDGSDFFWTFLDTWRDWGRNSPPGALQFYSYFPEMKIDRDGVHYWGNMFGPETALIVERGRWYCFEALVGLNRPGARDGEQAFWVDGRKIFHQRGIRWRDTEDLKLNSLMLDVYIHQSRRNNTCWFDDVVISRDYSGPLDTGPAK